MNNTLEIGKPKTDAPVAQVNKAKDNSSENKQQAQAPKSNFKDKYFTPKTIVGSLMGLATLGVATFVGVKYYNKVKAKNSSLKPDPQKLRQEIENIKERIDDIKKLVRKNYIEQKDYIYEEIKNSEDFDHDIHFKNLGDLTNQIRILQAKKAEKSAHADKMIAETRQKIKDRLAALSSNPEWKEIKALRKQHIKNLQSGTDQEKQKISAEKIPLINDLIYNRIYPESIEGYTNLYGIEDKKILELVRKEFNSHEDFLKEFESLKQPVGSFDYNLDEKRITHSGRLSLKDVFPKEFDIIRSNEKLKKEDNTQLNKLEKIHTTILEKLEILAEKYRQSSEYKEIKSLIPQMRTKQKQLARIESAS